MNNLGDFNLVQPGAWVNFSDQEQSITNEEKKDSSESLDDLDEVPVEKKDSDLDHQFNSLINTYYITIEVTSGCGDRGQGSIDSEWNKLVKFADEHPEFKARLPKSKQKSYDDGTSGMSSGLAALGSNRRRDDECIIS